MTKSMRALLVGAALSGFIAGTSASAVAQAGAEKSQTPTPESGKKATKTKVEKHSCKGKNSCKGKGGCGENKGKNDCKGKGDCATNGKPEKGSCKTPDKK